MVGKKWPLVNMCNDAMKMDCMVCCFECDMLILLAALYVVYIIM